MRPLVEEYFAWVKKILADQTALPKGLAAKGLNYSINQEEYLKVFLTDGEVPIDNSASERALRNFTIGRKNWMTINTVRGAQASAVIYSITETARANDLSVYSYIKYLLTEIPPLIGENRNIEQSMLEPLMP
ncbi:MAG: transposase [Lachnospiraceae bacterium]